MSRVAFGLPRFQLLPIFGEYSFRVSVQGLGFNISDLVFVVQDSGLGFGVWV